MKDRLPLNDNERRFKRMAWHMATMLEDFWDEEAEFDRASGDCDCELCGLRISIIHRQLPVWCWPAMADFCTCKNGWKLPM